jgi:hypothetical protein
MKMLIIFCSDTRLERVREILEGHDVHGYSEAEVRGSGVSGKHLGTRAWPGVSSLLFSVVGSDKIDELVSALSRFSESCSVEEGFRVLILPVEQMIGSRLAPEE